MFFLIIDNHSVINLNVGVVAQIFQMKNEIENASMLQNIGEKAQIIDHQHKIHQIRKKNNTKIILILYSRNFSVCSQKKNNKKRQVV
jgi:hypothetical protein